MVIHAHPRILFIHNKQQNDLVQIVLQLDVFHAMKCSRLRGGLTHFVLSLNAFC